MRYGLPSVFSLAVALLFTQQLSSQSPAPNSRIVRIATGSSYGLSGGGGDVTVDPKSIHSVTFWVHQSRPIQNVRSRISQKDWQRLLAAIDVSAIVALPSPSQCLPCVDLPETYVSLEFSDGTKKLVDYNRSSPPAAVKPVLRELGALVAKYIPPITKCPPSIPCTK